MGIKKKLIQEMQKYVDRNLLPVVWKLAYVDKCVFSTYDEFLIAVRDNLKGDENGTQENNGC